MDSEQRRPAILDTITESRKVLTGTDLAKLFNVTRQVIVQDIAILRAAGHEIIATPQGYMMPRFPKPDYRRIFAVKHTAGQIWDELSEIIKLGGKVLDVIIEHPLYGEFKGQLMITSIGDLKRFLARMAKAGAEPLSALTEGVHLHTVEANSIETLNQIEAMLHDKGFLLDGE